MVRTCAHCSRKFQSKTVRAKFCKNAECVRERERQKKRAQRAPGAAPVVQLVGAGTKDVDDAPLIGLGIEPAVLAELTSAGRENTSAGRASLALARRIDRWSEKDTGASYAALHRELRASVEAALAGAKVVGPVDELRKRREQIRSGA